MNKENELKVGFLYISYGDIKNYLGLSEDTQFIVSQGVDGVSIKVITNSSNEQHWLHSGVTGSELNIRRERIRLVRSEPNYDVILHNKETGAKICLSQSIPLGIEPESLDNYHMRNKHPLS